MPHFLLGLRSKKPARRHHKSGPTLAVSSAVPDGEWVLTPVSSARATPRLRTPTEEQQQQKHQNAVKPPGSSDPVPDPVQSPVAGPVPDPVQGAAVDSVPDPVRDGAADSVPDPIQDPVANSVPDPVQDVFKGLDRLKDAGELREDDVFVVTVEPHSFEVSIIESIGELVADENGEVVGIPVRTSKGEMLVDPSTMEIFVEALALYSYCLTDLPTARYDYLWRWCLENLRGTLKADQHSRLTSLFASPDMPRSALGLDSPSPIPAEKPADCPPIYEALGDGEFRLAILLPSDDTDAPVECILCHEKLDANPEYELVSYTRGGPSKAKPIAVNGHELQIPENLEAALRRLRKCPPESGATSDTDGAAFAGLRVLWVEAICVYQNSIPERNSQARLRGRILSQAKNACVWLGEKERSEQDARAVEFMRALPSFLSSPELDDILRDYDALDGTGAEARLRPLDFYLKDPYFVTMWEAAGRFFVGPWWEELFAALDVATAQSALVYCGDVEFRWTDVTNLHGVLMKHGTLRRYLREHFGRVGAYNAIRLLDRIEGMQPLPRDLLTAEGPADALSLLSAVRHTQVVDPRDKVYGVLGAVGGVDGAGSVLTIDYDAPVDRAFTTLAGEMMRQSRNLDILSHVTDRIQPTERMLTLPSWAPDWRFPLPSPVTIGYARGGDPAAGFGASGPADPKADLVFSADGREVSIPGFLVDTVSQVETELSIPGTATDGEENPPSSVLSTWKESLGSDSDELRETEYPFCTQGGQSMLEAFWRTVLGDRWRTVDASVEAGGDIRRLANEIPGLTSFPPSGEEEERLLLHLDTANGNAKYAAAGRRFFRSKQGMMGLAPRCARRGDLIVVLLGGRVPFILRPAVEGKYFFLGESYVHAIMDGEIVEERKAGKRDVERFVLI